MISQEIATKFEMLRRANAALSFRAPIATHLPWEAIWGLIGTLVGGIIGFVSGYIATTRTVKAQKELQRAEFDREDAATRAIISALLVDMYRFIQDAARNAVFEPAKWLRPLQRLLDFLARIEIGHALTQEQVQAVLSAGFEADLAFNRLSEEIKDKDLPFTDGFEERHSDIELDYAETLYVERMQILSRDAFKAFNRALRVMELSHHINREPRPTIADIRDDYRSQLGRMPVERNPENEEQRALDDALE